MKPLHKQKTLLFHSLMVSDDVILYYIYISYKQLNTRSSFTEEILKGKLHFLCSEKLEHGRMN